MSNAIFPKLPGLSWGSVLAPTFKTAISTAVNGKEYRSAMMATPVYALSLQFEFLRHHEHAYGDELRRLWAFYVARRGAFDSFLYEHPDDHRISDQLIGIGDGNTTAFQLLRGFDLEAVEPVMNIQQVTDIKIAGQARLPGQHYVISDSGVVVFTDAPEAGRITWSGSYYYRARFVDDVLDFEKFMRHLWRNNKVDLLASLGRKI